MPTPTVDLVTTKIPAKYSFLKDLDVGLDIILIGLWAGIAIVYAFTIGKRRGPVLVLSTYAGLAVSNVVAKLNLTSSGALSNFQKGEFFLTAVFLVTTLLAFVALLRVVKTQVRGPFTKNGIFLLGALESGAFLASAGSLLPVEMQKQITGFASVLFVTPWTLTLWLILPLVLFLISEHNQRTILNNV